MEKQFPCSWMVKHLNLFFQTKMKKSVLIPLKKIYFFKCQPLGVCVCVLLIFGFNLYLKA
jgi:hypothetical protein